MYLPNWVVQRVPPRVLTPEERMIIADELLRWLGRYDTYAFHEVYSRQNAVRP